MTKTVVAWLGAVIAEHEYDDFIMWFKEQFGHDVEGIGSAESKEGLVVFFFALKDQKAVERFAIQRLRTNDMKWACDTDRSMFDEADIKRLGLEEHLQDTQALWLDDEDDECEE